MERKHTLLEIKEVYESLLEELQEVERDFHCSYKGDSYEMRLISNLVNNAIAGKGKLEKLLEQLEKSS